MFGLSLGKILALIAVIVGVWIAFRWMQRASKLSAAKAQARRDRLGAPETTAKCPQCGVYVIPSTAGDCGRAGCPYARTAAR